MNAMSDSENLTGPNGTSNGIGQPPNGARTLGDHGRHIHHEVHALAAAVQDATNDVERYLTEQVRRRPYGTLGVAAGVGYVLGGGLSSRLTAVLLGTATRVTMALVARELGVWLSPGASAAAQNKTS